MDSDTQPTTPISGLCKTPDLRGIPLAKLSERAADPDDIVASTALRIVRDMKDPSHVQVMRFNSAI